MQITKNFNISEFNCKCGCEMPSYVYLNVIKLALQLQVLRDKVDKPIKINSAYRCKSHNRLVGGASNSQHLEGKAADVKVRNTEPVYISNLIEFLISQGDMLQGGIGIYDTFTHYDIRKNKARWDYRK